MKARAIVQREIGKPNCVCGDAIVDQGRNGARSRSKSKKGERHASGGEEICDGEALAAGKR